MVELRNYPYPYRALLSICSDLDETPNEEVYFETCKYLNTTQQTLIGTGVGLEVGNTIYFKMPPGQFSFESASESGKKKVFKLIRSGHIDCLHSFGDLVDSREQAVMYWDMLVKHGCNLKVWIDHAQAPSNLDTDIMQGMGALTGSSVYHADVLFMEGGIEYVWKGRVTSVISQNVKRSFRGIFNIEHPYTSTKTILKEFAKGLLGHLNSQKYSMHAKNRTLNRTALSDGQVIYEFMRSNPCWAGVSVFEKGRDIHKVVTDSMINSLISAEGSCILYTHLGKIHSLDKPFPDETIVAFEKLSKRYSSGELLILSTKRQLDYIRSRDTIQYSVEKRDGREAIVVRSDNLEKEQLSGITWYVDEPDNFDVYLGDILVDDAVRNPRDYCGMSSIMIPIKPLVYPDV
jgi:hypothetical protein